MHKRAFGPVAVVGAAALLMTACGGGSSTTTTTSATTSAGSSGSSGSSSAAASDTSTAAAPATSTSTGAPVRDANADLVIWCDSTHGPALKKIADKFAADQGMKVVVQTTPDTETRQQFGDATKVGKGPDIVVGAHDWLGEFVQNGVVAPVPLDAAIAAKFQPSTVAAVKFNGQNYGIPYAVENLGLVYNKDMVPTPPKTLDELVKQGQDLVKAGKAKQVLALNVSKKGNPYMAYPFFSAFGGGVFGQKANGDYNKDEVIVNNAGSVKAGELLAKLGKDKVISTNVDDTNVDQLFGSKAAPFLVGGPWSIPPAKKAGVNYGIAPLPTVEGGGRMTPFLGVQMFFLSSKAKNTQIAQEFLTNYATTSEAQEALFAEGQRPPALKEAYDKVSASNPDMKAWFEAGQGGKPMPNIPAMNAVWGPWGQAEADIVSGAAQPKARLDAAAKEIQAAIAKG
ncbi:sugar ABC transporter substrate-binding protein [Arsenicicoccus sp. oral taxon 190]|uniref:sugar ABC transporter substrate-binding protein n=1 Tax=Arsenicicoccus sp. oral taxon 190 TaxID=1658671 RepID=UPI000679EDED|nr:maltose ABC transporter substrate-binding protein [Arsenicicoccus sp. oral taxon 190]AKT50279.1 ABC transporter substrate-binding protein [Arsenicicoccus sp. oral taxon 190]